MKLVVAEKPSVAQSLAAVLGAKQKKQGYLEGGGFLVSWCVGHLVGLAPADAYDPKYSEWTYEDLPIIPKEWKFIVDPGKKEQFKVLSDLMNRADVDSLVCATDAGREGELIFRLVYQQAGCHKPMERLWISSMEEDAIKAGFSALRPSSEYDLLYAAALCRAKADWLVGITGTRLFSTLYRRTLNVGRVMTPTLALVVERETAIDSFKKEKFYTVELDCGFPAASDRMADKKAAEKLKAACAGQTATVRRVEKKQRNASPPKLYDLTSLQRDGNRLFGYTAQQVLDYAQALYEKKLLTYPRTDSNYLAEDTAATVPELLEQSVSSLPFSVEVGLTDISRVIDASKVSDHHALLPTMQVKQDALAALPAGERNILTLVIVRLLCAVSEKQVYEDTAVELDCGGTLFAAKGRVVTSPGWKAVEQAFLSTLKQKPEKDDPEPTALPSITEGQSLSGCKAAVREGTTSPPKHFTEDLLLSAMEHASAEEFAEIKDAERTGLGTPATRAGVIEKLVRGGFLERKGTKKTKVLLPTDKGKALITVMPEEIQSPEMTADWETKLLQIERSEMEPETFMTEIKEMISSLVNTTEAVKGANALMKNKVIGVCPNCGANVVEREKGWFCENRECRFVLWKDNAFFKRLGKRLDSHVADKLLRDGRVRLKDCKSAKGKTYNATVLLGTEPDGRSKFSLEFEGGC